MMSRFAIFLGVCFLASHCWASPPLYKPSSRSVEAIPITTNAYGGNAIAPAALGIGEQAPDFTLPVSGGSTLNLYERLKEKPAAIIFYRGHW